jgi:hypothetical protein
MKSVTRRILAIMGSTVFNAMMIYVIISISEFRDLCIGALIAYNSLIAGYYFGVTNK